MNTVDSDNKLDCHDEDDISYDNKCEIKYEITHIGCMSYNKKYEI